MSDPPFRVALVGLGFAATNLHLPALVTLPDATLVGGCDPDIAKRADVAGRWRTPTFDDFDAMIAACRPDVVVVSTPPSSHADYCRRSLAIGAHVVCEKPFASSVAEADAVIADAVAAGRQVALNHEFRVMPIFRAILDAVATGGRSDVRFVQVSQFIDLPPAQESGWRGSLRHRALFEAGVHLVDFVLAAYGELPISVSAAISTDSAASVQGDAVALVVLEYTGGRFAQITQCRVSSGEPRYFDVRIETKRESYHASFGGRARLSVGLYRSSRLHARFEYGASGVAWRETPTGRAFLARNPRRPNLEATRDILRRSFQAFRDRSAPPIPAVDGRDALRVIAACYLAASTGTRVYLDQPEDQSKCAALAMAGTTSLASREVDHADVLG